MDGIKKGGGGGGEEKEKGKKERGGGGIGWMMTGVINGREERRRGEGEGREGIKEGRR